MGTELWEQRTVWLHVCGNVELCGYTSVGTKNCVATRLWECRTVFLHVCGNVELCGYMSVGM